MTGQNRRLTPTTLTTLSRQGPPKYLQDPQRLTQPLPKTRVKGLRERNGNWHFRIKWNGAEVSGDTELPAITETVSEALSIREQKKHELKEGGRYTEISIKQIDMPVPEAIDLFLDWYKEEHKDKPNTYKWARGNLSAFRLFFMESLIGSLTPGDMETFKTEQSRRGLKKVSIRHSLKAANLLFKYGRKHGWLDADPLKDVNFPSAKHSNIMRVLSPEESAEYHAAALERSTDLADVTIIMEQQGCRPEEIFTLEQVSVDLNAREFVITDVEVPDRGVTCKSVASRRKLPMMPDVYTIMKRRKDGHSRWMFPSSRKPGTPIQTLQKAHEWVAGQTRIDCRIYDFRHTFATRLAVRGCPLPLLAMLIGHSDMTMLKKYIHPGQEDMNRAMKLYGQMAAHEQNGWLKVDRKGGRGPLSTPNKPDFSLILPNRRRRAG